MVALMSNTEPFALCGCYNGTGGVLHTKECVRGAILRQAQKWSDDWATRTFGFPTTGPKITLVERKP